MSQRPHYPQHEWRSPRNLSRDDSPPPGLRAWLLDPGSLTAHLRGRFGDRLAVTVLAEGEELPTQRERERLGLKAGEAYVRRVALKDGDRALVLARTVIPPGTLRGDGARLRELGETPLGELVFTDFAATRSEFELTRLAPPTPLFPALPVECWARRSVLSLATGPILVTEAFLPSLLDQA